MLLKKINVRSGADNGNSSNMPKRGMKILRLVILGKNELFGLEEIMANNSTRVKSVEC